MRKNTGKNITAVICICIIAFAAFYLIHFNLTYQEPAAVASEIPEPSETSTPLPTPVTYEWTLSEEEKNRLTALYEEDHAINEDVKAILSFQSGLIEEPVVQGDTNETYLRKNWETGEYLSWGSIEMDFRNNPMNDQNTLLYGHYVYPQRTPDRTIMFTPLVQLEQQENYEPNKYVNMVTSDEIITYEIAYVYNCPIIDTAEGQMPAEGYYFNELSYSESDLNVYLEHAKQSEYYDTGITISSSDRWLTMQTCVEGSDYNREIVVAKEISRESIIE